MEAETSGCSDCVGVRIDAALLFLRLAKFHVPIVWCAGVAHVSACSGGIAFHACTSMSWQVSCIFSLFMFGARGSVRGGRVFP